ncbi:hypothetical protein [Brevibacterium yomogidense]|uniref:hypothetical protein n=1 Tax=Brevibacterium yomogidense TaxID=946573 RepID=UPI0018DF4DDC|nr:hypothetical protein [Brevibacterium yomogidense]
MRTTTLMRTALAVGGVAAALSLSACDGVTINFGNEDEPPATTEPSADTDDSDTTDTDGTDEGATDGDDTSRAGDGTDSGSGDDTGTGGDDSGSGTGSDTSGEDTSQQNADFTLDEDGNGTIPVAVLEEDIKQAFEDQGTRIDSVDCFSDLSVYAKSGSQTCDVAVTGDRTYYGVVKVTDVVGQNVHYKLEFAGIDF